MVAPSTMLFILITVLVNQSYGATFFTSYIPNLHCPGMDGCDLSCTEGYETSIFGCATCKCRTDTCENFECREGQHCESIMRLGFLVFNLPHCKADEVTESKMTTTATTPTTTTAPTTTTTTTTSAPPIPKDVQICHYGEPSSNCSINSPCQDPVKYKCVILNAEGNGQCCLKQPLEPITLSPSSDEMPRCMQSPDTGPCRSLIPRYYYNVTVGKCEKFTYGGCRENENNFADLDSCRETCENPCNMMPTAGRCRAAIVRYFFNSTSGQCESFTFGGCQGNGNNYRTLSECRQTCDRSYNNYYFMGKNEVEEYKP